ncbi:MAG: laccase domain-containing protein [Parasutterella excrementihominis]
MPVLLCDKRNHCCSRSPDGKQPMSPDTVAAMRKKSAMKKSSRIGPHPQRSFRSESTSLTTTGHLLLKPRPTCIDRSGRWLALGLARFAKEALKQAGVTEVTDCERDTYSDPEHFYSYRRDKVTGRHGAFICKR